MNNAILCVQEYLDQAQQPVTGLQVELVFVGDTEPHKHRKDQLLYVIRGLITVQTEQGLWTVPPHCAIWIPGQVMHFARATSQASVANLYMEPQQHRAGLAQCGILFAQPLLRELILRLVHPAESSVESRIRETRLVSVLMDELEAAPWEPLHLPIPTERRLRRLVDVLTEKPGLKLSMGQWGALIGVSNRTLSRLFLRETGMSFGRWLQQWDIRLALQKLASGESVTNIAIDLGYESLSAFITMFRRILGTTPTRYLAGVQTLPARKSEQAFIHMDGRIPEVFTKIHVPTIRA